MTLLQRFSALLIVLLMCVPAWADFDAAMAKYQAGEFEQARRAFEALAAVGDRSALFNMGVMYYRGESYTQDPVKGYVLMKIANDGLEDEGFARTIQAVSNRFDEQQNAAAQALFWELDAIYNVANLEQNIFPKPLDDEDCLPTAEARIKVAPKYPIVEQRRGAMGVVYMEFTVSPEGYARDVSVVRSTSKEFTKSSAKANRRFRYDPPQDGKPIYGERVAFIYHLELGGGSKVNTHRLTRSLGELEEKAKSGDVIAQYRYAMELNTYRHFSSYLEKVDLQYRTANDWYRKSAEGGLPHAQYEMGLNMLAGRGCEVDEANGYKWIKAAAVSGYSPAQKALAQLALTESDRSREKALAAVGWLKIAVQAGNDIARLMLAWELSTSSSDEIRNPDEALALLKIKPDGYFDEVRVHETTAAAYAAKGDFKRAIKFQKKAAKAARKLEWEIPLVDQRLASYEAEQPYYGSYY